MSDAALRAVLVTGATGALGSAVIRAFVTARWNVRTMSRRPPAPESIAAGLPHFAGDICDRKVLATAMHGVDVVVHLAALLHVAAPPAALEDEYVRVNVEGTRAVVETAMASGVSRVMLASSICVYEGSAGSPVDEATPASPLTYYATTKAAAEKIVLSATHADGTPAGVVVRLAAVYGGAIKGNYNRLVCALARGRFIPIGSGSNRRTLIYEADAAEAIVLAATHPAAAGKLFNATDGHVHTVAEITAAIADALGRRTPRLVVPIALARVGARAVELLFDAIGRPAPYSRKLLEKYLEDVAVSGEAIVRDLGFRARWSLARGWKQAVDDMRRNRQL